MDFVRSVSFALLGFYLRTEDRRRRSTAEQVRQVERLELARDLHDHVAHHVTAIIVQAQAGEPWSHGGAPTTSSPPSRPWRSAPSRAT
ncbi:histidine kinase dimerization/phosphoacceptor domain-containing protein [Streptomyces sp. A0592]|uniref:histidine kinase n=1 Tax=Streptomyces sp. A0592 TaxID=2563099 RepID=UPI001F0E13E9|nr:histidine kinase dimerization/phosphoacceptor domain-containing protein [Streptomyces sp. A0592]